MLCTKHPVTPIQLNPWFPLRDTAGGTSQEPSPQTSPYLDTLNLGKVILFLMNKVNFSASDSRAGLKNTSAGMCPSLGSPGSRESLIWWKFIQPETGRPRKLLVSPFLFWSFTMQAVLATSHRAPTWSAPHQVQLGWERGQQHHSLPGNMVINFNRAPAKDLTGLHSAVEMYTLASHEPCGGDSCSHLWTL